jgi:hypothetical protein
MENFGNQINKIEKKEKPAILYLSAQAPNIQELLPMRGNIRDENEGPVIFATPDKAYASTFLVKEHGDLGIEINGYGILSWLSMLIRAPFGLLYLGGTQYLIAEMGIDEPDPPKNMEYLQFR